VKRLALIATASVIAFAAILYLGDSLVLHFRANRYDAVAIQRYYAIAQKTGHIELQYDHTFTEQCTRSMFPHAGLQPCWYLRRHAELWTKI
jgi:hypothetical protein